MIRRWIIRGLAIALLTLCVTAWVGSYWHSWARLFDWGYVALEAGEVRGVRVDQKAWLKLANPPPPSFRIWKYDDMKYRVLGVAYDTYAGPPRAWAVMLPLWFPTVLSAGLLWLIWRKTRPKYTGKGFPVEPAAKSTQP